MASKKQMTTDFTRSHEIAQRTLALMSEHGLAGSPPNYAVCYSFISGANRELTKVISAKLEAGGPLNQPFLDELHDKYFSTQAAERAMADLSDTVTAELSSVQSLLKTASQDTASYGNTLEGVSHQLTKGHDPNLMKVVIDNLVTATKQMASRSQQLEERLKQSTDEVTRLKENLETVRTEAMTDQLTQLPNRRAFDETLSKAILAAQKNGTPLSLIFGDIDHFKKFNDTWGHQTGDQVLKLVAHCMNEGTRAEDMAARFGGEEFAVVSPNAQINTAREIAERIRSNVESKRVMKRSTGEDLGTITMSLGVALFDPFEDMDTFIKRADACLYAAKHAGRNQVLTELDIDTDQVLQDAGAARAAKAGG